MLVFVSSSSSYSFCFTSFQIFYPDEKFENKSAKTLTIPPASCSVNCKFVHEILLKIYCHLIKTILNSKINALKIYTKTLESFCRLLNHIIRSYQALMIILYFLKHFECSFFNFFYIFFS